MPRYGAQYGPDITFLGVDRCDLRDPASFADADVVVLGAPFDGGTSHRPGARFGPQAIRMTDYLAHDGSRPSLALRTDGLRDLRVVDAGDVEMFSGDIGTALPALEAAVETVARSGAIPVVLGGDHSIAFADATGVANVLGHGRVSMLHFDAHADTGDIEFGSLWGHGQPMRRLIESGALRGDRFLQIGLRGYWPAPETLDWMARAADAVLRDDRDRFPRARGVPDRGLRHRDRRVRGRLPLRRHRRLRSRARAGHRHARTGRAHRPELLDSVRRICLELPVVGIDVVEVSPPYDHADITAALANRIVLEALSAIARRRRDARDGTMPSPADPGIPSRAWDPSLPLLAERPAAGPTAPEDPA